MLSLPVKVPGIKISNDKPNLPIGVSVCIWSCDSRFIATKCDNMPNAIWIWDARTLSLHALLIQMAPVKSMAWSSKGIQLAFCTGGSRIYFWSFEGASVCDIPHENNDFKVFKIKWAPDGNSMVLMDKGSALLVYPRFELMEGDDAFY